MAGQTDVSTINLPDSINECIEEFDNIELGGQSYKISKNRDQKIVYAIQKGSTYALKMLNRDSPTFANEIKNLRWLKSSNCEVCRHTIPIIEIIEDSADFPDHVVVVMPWVHEDFKSNCANGVLYEEEALRIALMDIVRSIKSIEPKVHCDVKPSNILRYNTGWVLSDFEHMVDSGTKAIGGTPSYMAPEQDAGGKVTSATDVYAIGCLAYVALTNKTPYDKTSRAAKESNEPPVLNTVSPRFAGLICEMLRFDASMRPALDEILFRLNSESRFIFKTS